MILTAEQLKAVHQGEPLRFTAPETNSEFVLLPADVFDRVKAILDDEIDDRQVAAVVAQTMQEYDEGDPLLESYQTYRQSP